MYILGEALHWKEPCRIQYLPTRQYLAVMKDHDSYKVVLKARSSETESETDTIFSLVPVIEGDDNVTFGSYARIYHNSTDSWLHAEKGVVLCHFSYLTVGHLHVWPRNIAVNNCKSVAWGQVLCSVYVVLLLAHLQ